MSIPRIFLKLIFLSLIINLGVVPPSVGAKKSGAKSKSSQKSSSSSSSSKRKASSAKSKNSKPKNSVPNSASKKRLGSVPPAAAAAPVKTEDGLPTKDSKAKAKATSLTVTTNTKVGTIYLDGILAGDVGTPIETDAGVVEIMVKSDGFISQKAKVRIRENESNQISLILQKPQPKPKPTPKPKLNEPEPNSGSQNIAGVPGGVDKGSRGQKSDTYRSTKNGGSVDPGVALNKLPAPDLQNELFGREDESAMMPQPQLSPQGPQPMYPSQPGYGPAPMYPQPQYQYPYPVYPTQPYGYYPPQYAQPAYPSYPMPPPQQPGALVPNDPFAVPQSSGGMSSQDVFTEPSQPNSGGGGGYGQSQDTAPVPIEEPGAASSSSSKPKKSKASPFPAKAKGPAKLKRSRAGKANIFVSLMPLGIGQFYQGKVMLGGAFALAQAGAVYYALDSKAKADQQAAKAKSINDDATFTDAEKSKFLEESNTYIDEQNKAKDIGWALFGVAWVLGATEAIVNPPRVNSRRSSYSLLSPEQQQPDRKLMPDQNELLSERVVTESPYFTFSHPSDFVQTAEREDTAPLSLQLGLVSVQPLSDGSITPVLGAHLQYQW